MLAAAYYGFLVLLVVGGLIGGLRSFFVAVLLVALLLLPVVTYTRRRSLPLISGVGRIRATGQAHFPCVARLRCRRYGGGSSQYAVAERRQLHGMREGVDLPAMTVAD